MMIMSRIICLSSLFEKVELIGFELEEQRVGYNLYCNGSLISTGFIDSIDFNKFPIQFLKRVIKEGDIELKKMFLNNHLRRNNIIINGKLFLWSDYKCIFNSTSYKLENKNNKVIELCQQ